MPIQCDYIGSYYDDDDFTIADMCCACGGGTASPTAASTAAPTPVPTAFPTPAPPPAPGPSMLEVSNSCSSLQDLNGYYTNQPVGTQSGRPYYKHDSGTISIYYDP